MERYDPEGPLTDSPDGGLIYYADHLAKLAEIRRAVEVFQLAAVGMVGHDMSPEFGAAWVALDGLIASGE